MASINIVLKAIDQYSGPLTGLNQGIELAQKAMAAFGAAADVVWQGVKEGIDLAARGGAFAEIQSQFNNVANSFGVDGDRILKDLDRISFNMIGLEDAAKIAGRGITAGLSPDQLETAFTFIKRRTELTGESFTAMSEQVFRALASGRTSVLGQMGLVIERGASMTDVIAAMSAATEGYGATVFNTADKLTALSNQQDIFTTKIGVAINGSETFQKALTSVTDVVIKMIEAFDPRPLILFFDGVLSLAFEFVRAFVVAIPSISAAFDAVFGGTNEDFGEWIRGLTRTMYRWVAEIASAVNTVVAVLNDSGIISIFSALIKVAGFFTGSRGLSEFSDGLKSFGNNFRVDVAKIIEQGREADAAFAEIDYSKGWRSGISEAQSATEKINKSLDALQDGRVNISFDGDLEDVGIEEIEKRFKARKESELAIADIQRDSFQQATSTDMSNVKEALGQFLLEYLTGKAGAEDLAFAITTA